MAFLFWLGTTNDLWFDSLQRNRSNDMQQQTRWYFILRIGSHFNNKQSAIPNERQGQGKRGGRAVNQQLQDQLTTIPKSNWLGPKSAAKDAVHFVGWSAEVREREGGRRVIIQTELYRCSVQLLTQPLNSLPQLDKTKVRAQNWVGIRNKIEEQLGPRIKDWIWILILKISPKLHPKQSLKLK